MRRKNVLSVLAQCMGCAGLVTILWWACGYSLTFSPGTAVLGGLKFAGLSGVTAVPNADYSAWVSQNVFSMYQLMFAIITPALIVGAIAERMKYAAIMGFILLWMFIVYFPLAHMVWGIDGLMNGVWNAKASIKAIDFAGGTVVHMSSGWSALVLCLILGKRKGFGDRPFLPHSMVLTMGSAGTGSTPAARSPPTASPPTPSPRPRWRPPSPARCGRCWSGSRAASRRCWVSVRASWPGWW